MNKSFEVIAHQFQQKTLPQKLRDLGVVVLFSEYVPYWQGPELPNLHQVGATSFHFGETMTSEGTTFWFYAPESVPFLEPEVLQRAVDYIVHRMGRRTHQSDQSWTSIITPLDSPVGNN